MNTVESLSIRTTVARARLTQLERRVEQNTAHGAVIKPALKELSTALEELQVANEQLSLYVNELAAVRHGAASVNARLDEFINVLPLPCIWTDEQGVVREANESSAALFNVAARRLTGKPLSLFVADRPAFFDAIGLLTSGRSHVVDVAVQVRPRERRPRLMRLIGQKMRHDDRLCWIFREDFDATGEPAVAEN